MMQTYTKRNFDLDDFVDEEGSQERKRCEAPGSLDSFLTIHRDTLLKPVKTQGKVFDCATSIGKLSFISSLTTLT